MGEDGDSLAHEVSSASASVGGGCHIGGLPGRYGEDLDDPYPGANTWTAKPDAPSFKSDAPVSCD